MQISESVSRSKARDSVFFSLTGNCFLPLWIPNVDKHFGAPVFFSVLSRAHTFSIGSFDRSSDMVTSKAVPSTCFMCVMEPVSCALKVRTTLNAWDKIRTCPSLLPTKRLSDPEHTQLSSLLFSRQRQSTRYVI